MLQQLKSMHYKFAGTMTVGALALSSGKAQAANNFSNIAQNVTKSIESLPGLLTALTYLFGLLIAVLGILKIKDHVENPSQTPLKDGAIRLAIGGALFALPIVMESVFNTVGVGNQQDLQALKKVSFVTN